MSDAALTPAASIGSGMIAPKPHETMKGIAAPSATPIVLPIAASTSTCAS